MAKDIFIPKLGQTMEEVTLLNWLVKDGEKVEKGQAVADVETDKAVFPIETNSAGIIHLGPFSAGEIVPVLTVVAIVGTADDVYQGRNKTSLAEEPQSSTPDTKQELDIEGVLASIPAITEGAVKVFISPRAKKLALNNNLDLGKIQPTGNDGQRIIEKDVNTYLTSQPKITPLAGKIAGDTGVDLSQIQGSGPRGRIMKSDVLRGVDSESELSGQNQIVKRIPLTGIRGVIAARMAESTQGTSRVTLFMEADATRFVELREMLKTKFSTEWGFTPGYNDLLAVVCSQALIEFPYMNARINGDQIEWLGMVHMGIAVDTERGLIVPVVRNADRKQLQQFGKEFRNLVDKAQKGILLPEDMNGGTFTITNLGGNDVLAFTPVINLPQAAILGVGKISPALAMRNGAVVEYQKLILSLVFDHRIVDGAPAARFLQWIKDRIEYPELLGFH
jgi:pyruvate dehydrogenase E2 component (dihydrolipoamide acetyltransferase)